MSNIDEVTLPPFFWRWLGGIVLAFLAGLGATQAYDLVAVQGIEVEPEEQAFITLLNNYRQQNGLQPVILDTKLQKAAEWKSQDMVNNNIFGHTDSLGRDPFAMMCEVADYCYNAYKGEILGAGYTAGAAVFEGWRNSPGHNAVMLGQFYTATGISRIACSTCTYGYYWTGEYGSVVSTPLASPTPTPKVSPTNVPPVATVVNPTPLPKPCAADFNGDRKVDGADLLLLLAYYNTRVTTASAKFDLAKDGLINSRDVSRWYAALGPCPI